jgi:ParB family chromosome partitioning protein
MANRTIKEIGQVLLIPRTDISPFPNQPRKFFDPKALQELADSIKTHGQVVPVHVKELDGKDKDPAHRKFELVDGQRRWHACAMADQHMMKAIVDPIVDEEDQYTNSIIANFDREPHTPLEVAQAVAHYRKNKTIPEIARIFSRSDTWVSLQLKLGRLDPKIFEMMSPTLPDELRLSFSAALLIADVPQERQMEVAQKIVGKRMKIDQARAYVRLFASGLGVKVGSKERSPKADYNVFKNFLDALRRDEAMFLDMLPDYFPNMFYNRHGSDHALTVQRLESAIRCLAKILARVKEAKRKDQ